MFISHRGNISGPNPERENTVDYIREALSKGYDCETDLWWHNGEFWTGHDRPTSSQIEALFSRDNQSRIIFHCKTIQTLHMMVETFRYQKFHYFFHGKDPCTLTSLRMIWTFPGQELTPNSIWMFPETTIDSIGVKNVAGVCSDYIEHMKQIYDRMESAPCAILAS